MKDTGMVRRIDELGRIVIPKEIRKQLMMKEGESVAFSIEDDRVIITRFSIMNKMSPIIQVLLDNLEECYHNVFLFCDQASIITSSSSLSKYQKKELDQDVLFLIQRNEKIIEKDMYFFDEEVILSCFPIKRGEKNEGSFLMLTKQTPYYMMNENLIDFIIHLIEQEIEKCV